MYARELCSQTRVPIAAEDVLLNVYEIDGAEDLRKTKTEVRIDAARVEEGERRVSELHECGAASLGRILEDG